MSETIGGKFKEAGTEVRETTSNFVRAGKSAGRLGLLVAKAPFNKTIHQLIGLVAILNLAATEAGRTNGEENVVEVFFKGLGRGIADTADELADHTDDIIESFVTTYEDTTGLFKDAVELISHATPAELESLQQEALWLAGAITDEPQTSMRLADYMRKEDDENAPGMRLAA